MVELRVVLSALTMVVMSVGHLVQMWAVLTAAMMA